MTLRPRLYQVSGESLWSPDYWKSFTLEYSSMFSLSSSGNLRDCVNKLTSVFHRCVRSFWIHPTFSPTREIHVVDGVVVGKGGPYGR